MKKFTLIRYNKKTPFLEMERLNIAEPEGYKDLDFDLKRDNSVHGVFFEFSTELKFYNYLITENNAQINSNAYDFIKSAYAQDGVNTRIQLLVIEDNITLFDLYFNMQSFKDDPLNSVWSCNCETKEPFLLKDRQEQKVKMAADKTVQLRETNIFQTAESAINSFKFQYFQTDFTSQPTDTITPTFNWDAEVDFGNTVVTDGIDEDQVLFTTKSFGDYNFEVKHKFCVFITAPISINTTNASFELILRIDSQSNTNLYTNNITLSNPQHIESYFFFGVYINVFLFENTQSGTLNINVSGAKFYVNVKLITAPTISGIGFAPDWRVIYYIKDTDYFNNVLNQTSLDILSQSGFSFFNIYYQNIKASTPCTGELLGSAFEQILAKANLNLQSSIMNNLEQLGSIFITLGRRIARATTEIDLSLNFKDTFEESQKMFNLGYGISGTNVLIESINYFYDKTTFYQLSEVSELEISYANEFSYNVFLCGYDKFKEDKLGKLYENEAYNSRREYNIEGTVAEKKLDVKTKFIASNWIVEKLRRDVDKNDDEQIFVFALNRSEITSTKYNADATSTIYPANTVVEGIEPYDEADNEYYGLDKENIFNIRLSPRRIAMNWESILKTSLYKFDALEQKAMFISGEPKTQLRIADVIENENIDLSLVSALFKPEKYELKTYLSLAQFIDIKSNYLYKLIKFEYNLIDYEGFILSAKYNFNTALLELTLIANSDD
jgi:hypothetical protein